MKKFITLVLLFCVVVCQSQEKIGRVKQSTTLIISYKVLPDDHYDIFVQNAHKDTSIVEFVLKDTTFNVRLGNWQKHQFVHHYPNGFTLRARNVSYPGMPEDWMECGSKRQIDKVNINITYSPLLNTSCNGKTITDTPFYNNWMR